MREVKFGPPRVLLHACTFLGTAPIAVQLHGPAVTYCVEHADGTLWVHTGSEYANQVNWCPYCGYRAPLVVMARDWRPSTPGEREDWNWEWKTEHP